MQPNTPPYAVPRSALPGVLWPAVPDANASALLALQFQLEQSQWWPAALIEERQRMQVERVLEHAKRTVPYYADRLREEDARALCDPARWSRVPILTRRDLQINKASLLSCAVPPQHGKVGEISSSGSTGQPITVQATDYLTLLWRAFTLREHLWHRRDFSGKLCAIRYQSGGGAMPPEGVHLDGWGPSTDAIYRTGPSSVLNIKASIGEQAAWLVREDPDYLLTHPTSALALLGEADIGAGRLSRLRELRTFSEALPAELRRRAREVWGVKLVDMYSAREVGYIALQCPEFEHYHLQSENLLVEILDPSGMPCPAGTPGRVVITTLHNFATPLIRYEIGDYAQFGPPCPCGRGLPVLDRVLGRVRNMLALPNGERHWPVIQADVVHTIAPILQQQVAQVGPDELELRLVAARPLTETEELALTEHLCTNLGHRFAIRLRYVEDVPRGPTGKFEEFVCELLD